MLNSAQSMETVKKIPASGHVSGPSINERIVVCCSFSVAVNCRKLSCNSCKQALTCCSPKSTLQVVKARFTFLSLPFFSLGLCLHKACCCGGQRDHSGSKPSPVKLKHSNIKQWRGSSFVAQTGTWTN